MVIRQKLNKNHTSSMSLNLNTLGISGAILFWLGVVICVLSLALFIAISTGITDGVFSEGGSFDGTSTLTFHHADRLLIGWRDKLVFLLPLAAGIILTLAGLHIRSKVPEYQKAFKAADSHFESRKYSAGNNKHEN